jgi:2-polyprenyl-6-methoxyphenol hydroxylase-like FAD-dependent oxidoreductase
MYSTFAMRVLISGAGIAGPTLAYWLAHYGFEPTIVEKAPKLRTSGYIIDFWGLGFDVADRMGLLPEIHRKGYMVREVRVVDRSGKRIAGFPGEAIARIAEGRYISLARGDLSACIFGAIEGKVESIFNDSIARIDQTTQGVQVRFESGTVRDFDLVIGADGLHSQVRKLVFGPQSQFEKYLGYKVAAFEVHGYKPRDELVYVMYTNVGKQVGRFAMRGDRTMFLFIFADKELDVASDNIQSQKTLLQERFGNSGWECQQILRALDSTNDLYFDRVSQIEMGSQSGSWTRGWVTLLGDAAFCVSLLAGQGSALAMVGAYILAGELHRAGGDHALAFAKYQDRYEAFVRNKQKGALRFASAFAPKSKFSMFIRNQVMNLLRIPWVADLAAGRELADNLELPNY